MRIKKSKILIFLVLIGLLFSNCIIWAQEEKVDKSPKPPEATVEEASQATPVSKEGKPIDSSLILSGPVIASPVEIPPTEIPPTEIPPVEIPPVEIPAKTEAE